MMTSSAAARSGDSAGDQQAVREVIEALAIVRTRTAGKNTVRANGQEVPGRYRELFVLNRTDAGWKIAQYSSSPSPINHEPHAP